MVHVDVGIVQRVFFSARVFIRKTLVEDEKVINSAKARLKHFWTNFLLCVYIFRMVETYCWVMNWS